jgi:hypothetical protein
MVRRWEGGRLRKVGGPSRITDEADGRTEVVEFRPQSRQGKRGQRQTKKGRKSLTGQQTISRKGRIVMESKKSKGREGLNKRTLNVQE